jgi:hypothetical protein
MTIEVILSPRVRDYRLDLLRSIAHWAIFLDHIPNSAVNGITQRNYGFSDAADLFVFISGYTASFVDALIMLERGVLIGATQASLADLCGAHHPARDVCRGDRISLSVTMIQTCRTSSSCRFYAHPSETLNQGLLLAFKPVNMDVLPLYILLMVFFSSGTLGDAAAT